MTGQILTRSESPNHVDHHPIITMKPPILATGYYSSYLDLIRDWLNIICSWSAFLPLLVCWCALCAPDYDQDYRPLSLWTIRKCYTVTSSNAIINLRDMGPIVSGPVTRCDVGYHPATSKLWEHSWHLVTWWQLCQTLAVTRAWDRISSHFNFQLDPMELNNTRKVKREILFFNRVPKVGSQTTMELLKQLSVKNHFHYHKDKTQKVEQIKLPYSKEVSKISKLDNFVKVMFSNELFRNGLQIFLSFWSPPLPM